MSKTYFGKRILLSSFIALLLFGMMSGAVVFADSEGDTECQHEYSEEWTVDVESTCTVPGEKSHHCLYCESRIDVTPLELLQHEYSSEWTVDVKPTCTESGSKSHHCIHCEATTGETVIEPLPHEYSEEWTVDLEPTCTESGSKSHHCLHCEAITDETVVEPLRHDYQCVSEDPATCHSTGLKYFVCSHDSSHRYEETTPALEHVESDWIIDYEPTYHADGSRHKECVLCHDVLKTETVSVLSDITPPTGKITVSNSSWTKYSDIIKATYYKNQVQTVFIDAEDSETGVKKVEYAVSEEVVSVGELALLSWKKGTSFSIESDGSYVIYARITDNSDNVGYVSTDMIVIDMSTPKIVGIVDSEIYCVKVSFSVEDDNLLYVKVNGNKVSSDGKGNYTISARNGIQSVEACDSANNVVYVTVMVNEKHTYSTLVTDTEPDCYNGGVGHYECIYCKSIQYEMLDAYGHGTPKDWEVTLEPTCEKSGTEVKRCTRCGIILEEAELAKLNHDYKNGVCVICGKVYSKEIPTVAIAVGVVLLSLCIGIVIYDKTKKAKNARAILRAQTRMMKKR